MASNGTNQSSLYDVRRNTPSEQMRDRSMEQSNSYNSGNPHGYIPPTFNPETGQWDTPLSYSVPTVNGVQMPTGPQALMPNFNPAMLSKAPNMYVPNFGPGGTGGVGFGGSPIGAPNQQQQSGPPMPNVLPGLNKLPGPVAATPPPSPGNPQPGTSSPIANSNPLQTSANVYTIPKFNDGSSSSTLAQHFIGNVPPTGAVDSGVLTGFLPRMQTDASDGAHAYDSISSTPPSTDGNSALSQQLRYLKRFKPPQMSNAKAGTGKTGRGKKD